ncbi:hypothetical protein GIB67_027172 [Kingdonia uniflora]|uniref:MATH domain-containing protein n=1 Tax=Kingdonia uniflora TaxID=39325 RepID=A0A7J7P1Z7_9MAGN|nr:hypothetical protein GIB67_027172 [Kingdonia uniflora]
MVTLTSCISAFKGISMTKIRITSHEDEEGMITGVVRDVPPTHYTFKVELFSVLSNSSIEKYESCDFEAGGYKWKLLMYPKGNKNGKGYVSLYLEIADMGSLLPGWEVNVIFRFFCLIKLRTVLDLHRCIYLRPKGSEDVENIYLSVYLDLVDSETISPVEKVFAEFKLRLRDQISDKHLEIIETHWFIGANDSWGYPGFIKLENFNDKTKGYLVNDVCILEAEVTVRGLVTKFP